MAAKAKFNENSIMFVSLGTQKIPEFREVKNKDWVYYGVDNTYPDYLISLYERSATHGAILSGKVNYIIGQGWGAKKGKDPLERAKTQEFIQNINPDESLDELSEKIVLDFELYDGFALEVIKRKGKKGYDLFYIPFNKIRTNEDSTKFYYSKDWSKANQSPEKTDLREYNAFDPKENKSLFYYRILSPRKGSDPNVYPLPNYVNGTQAIETEIEADNFNLSEIKTGFKAGTMINFYNGIPTPDESKVVKNQIKKEYTGSEGTGFVLNFSDGKDRGSEVITLNGDNLPDRYMNVRNSASKTIFTVHKVSSPELFGVMQENVTFGGRAQIAEQYELFQNTYINKRQNILEDIFNQFAKLQGVAGCLFLVPTAAINTDVFSEAVIVEHLPKAAITGLIADRMGIDLEDFKVNGQVTETVERAEMNEDKDPILEGFLKLGRKRDQFEIIKSRSFEFEDNDKAAASEMAFEEENVDDVPTKALNIPVPTKDQKKDAKRGLIEILYSYELRFDAPDLKGSSRKFCTDLVRADLLYTRAEINSLDNGMDLSVWKYKGGWYNNGGTNRPQCRHEWRQNIVIKK